MLEVIVGGLAVVAATIISLLAQLRKNKLEVSRLQLEIKALEEAAQSRSGRVTAASQREMNLLIETISEGARFQACSRVAYDLEDLHDEELTLVDAKIRLLKNASPDEAQTRVEELLLNAGESLLVDSLEEALTPAKEFLWEARIDLDPEAGEAWVNEGRWEALEFKDRKEVAAGLARLCHLQIYDKESGKRLARYGFGGLKRSTPQPTSRES